MADPEPTFTAFRVFVFLSGLSVAVAQLEVVPPEVKPWLVAAGVVINLALATFFDTTASRSVVKNITARFKSK